MTKCSCSPSDHLTQQPRYSDKSTFGKEPLHGLVIGSHYSTNTPPQIGGLTQVLETA
jgi:hypothetical protein